MKTFDPDTTQTQSTGTQPTLHLDLSDLSDTIHTVGIVLVSSPRPIFVASEHGSCARKVEQSLPASLLVLGVFQWQYVIPTSKRRK